MRAADTAPKNQKQAKNNMRRPIKKRKVDLKDSVYQSELVGRLINYIMLDGKKNIARDIVYGAMKKIKDELGVENPLEILETAVKNASPNIEVRSRRVGGANYQIPYEIRHDRRIQLALRTLVKVSRSGAGRPTQDKLAEEIIKAHQNEGAAIQKKEETHRMAEANKAFAHLAW